MSNTSTQLLPKPVISKQENDSEIFINQLLSTSFSPEVIEHLQTRDAELAKQEEEIQLLRQRIRTLIISGTSSTSGTSGTSGTESKITFKPVGFVPPTKRDMSILGRLSGVEYRIANALADYLVANSLTSFTRPAFSSWCNGNDKDLRIQQVVTQFHKWSHGTYGGNFLRQKEKNGVTITYMAEGKFSAWIQQCRQVV
jgi:hypothetical protein